MWVSLNFNLVITPPRILCIMRGEEGKEKVKGGGNPTLGNPEYTNHS